MHLPHCDVAAKMFSTNCMLPQQVAATILLLLAYGFAVAHSTPTPAFGTTAIPTTTTTPSDTVFTTPAAAAGAYFSSTAAVETLVAVDAEGEVIGATSLAAAAAGAAAIAHDDANANANAGERDPSVARSRQHHHDAGHGFASSKALTAKSANLLLEDLQLATGHTINLTRHHDGDVFRTNGVTSCDADTCVGLSSGTAGLMYLDGPGSDGAGHATAVGSLAGGNLELLARRTKVSPTSGTAGSGGKGESCQCRCLPYLNTYREDLGICVDDIHECTLSPFVSGSSSEKIPFVFLPLRGQIIYPSREISFPEIRTPVCAVTGAQYLTTNGWSDLRNPIDNDYPFRMFRDEGRTFLQWLGEADLRQKMQGRLIVVHLVCRDMTVALNATTQDHLMPPKNVFSPCVAFRINGSPVKYIHNVSEVLFQSEATSTLASTSDGMTTKEYVVIGVCSLLLGLIYVSSVFLYLHMKKRKNRDRGNTRSSLNDLANEINYPKNDQVTFGAPFNRSGSLYSATSLGNPNEPRSRTSICSLKEEMGIVKNNPLLQHFPQLSEHLSGFASDISNSNSECELEASHHEKLKQSMFSQLQTSALVHPQLGINMGGTNGSPKGSPTNSNGRANGEESNEPSASPTQENECLPTENVAIVEDMMTEEKLENLRAMVNGTIRRKLYFNPAYFEPHLLAQPPPAAIEFLQKIREVISIAKYKMATKRYQPSLIMIPEEGPLRSNTSNAYGTQMQAQAECQGCANNRCTGHIRNCGDKRNSIEKWLQSVPTTEQQQKSTGNALSQTNAKDYAALKEQSVKTPTASSGRSQEQRCSPPAGSRSSPPRKEITPPKQRPPPPPAPNESSKPSRSEGKANVIEITHGSSAKYQPLSSKPSSSVNIPVNQNYETFSALSAAANIYGFAETGSEIYNNPKFTLHDSPAASQRSRGSSHRSKSSRKRLDVLDQYAAASTPTSLTSADRQHYEMLRNMKQMPDMVYDAISRDYSATIRTNGSFHLDIPTPDYDSTMEKKIKDIYNSTQSSAPSVPTPDYSTLSLGRKSLKQCQQPDSPIYRRKSPQYLIVDYETDSLERLETTKRKSSQSSSSPSSDVSSQLSPSLSTALPLEEELEISHTVYDRIDGFRKEGDGKKKLVAKSDSAVQKQKEIAARIKYDTPFRGSMTIEVEHEPQSDLERSTDSDQFEPDTLDRKPKKQSFCDLNAWAKQLTKPFPLNEPKEPEHYTHVDSICSLPDMSRPGSAAQASFKLQASSSFRSQANSSPVYKSHVEMRVQQTTIEKEAEDVQPAFSSLREIYQTALVRQNSQQSCKCGGQVGQYLAQATDTLSEQGRLLTLDAKHTRRQRVTEVAPSTPPVVEITKVHNNKTTIKISTPKVSRAALPFQRPTESAIVEPQNSNPYNSASHKNTQADPSPTSTCKSDSSKGANDAKKRLGRAPPPPPPNSQNTSASTTLTSQKSQKSHYSSRNSYQHQHPANYQNHNHYMLHSTTGTEEETQSNHSVSTEITGVSDTVANSEYEGSCNNTLSSVILNPTHAEDPPGRDSPRYAEKKQSPSPPSSPAVKGLKDETDYGAMFNTKINGLRNDYSLTKYLNRRKSQDFGDERQSAKDVEALNEANNNGGTAKMLEADPNKLDVLSISSRSNRSSSRLSDRTKEMYRNAGVPVGIAYPQRSSAVNTNNNNNNNNTGAPPSSNVQTVYRCEIEPIQLTHGMQIAMGLKDRAKKAKDLKNAWKKFVSMAAAKFSPTQSPAPPFDKKMPSFLEVLDRDEGISSLIDDTSTAQAPNPNYYEQRFGVRPQEMDSGYMSADSSEVYKRSFYDRYNFKLMSGRDHIIRVDTIEDNSDGGSTLTDRHNGVSASARRGSILDSNRFEDFEHMSDPPVAELNGTVNEDISDADSDRTLTRASAQRLSCRSGAINVYSSEDEQGNSTSYGSSETDGETNAEDMWESGAESIETHSVLYKNVRKN